VASLFHDEATDAALDPMTLKGKMGYATSVIKFDSIFAGSKVSLQLKLNETVVSLQDGGVQRMLAPRVRGPTPVSAPQPAPAAPFAAVGRSDPNAIPSESDESESEPEAAPMPMPSVKRVMLNKKK
jgi:hypothetical protein